ncbi:MAG: diguanylate cyclase, partial [Bradyrhizobium icense]
MRGIPSRATEPTSGVGGFATSFRRGPGLWLLLCGTLLSAAILIGTAVMIGQFRERALANGERELQNTILLLTRHFDQQFDDSNIIARNIVAQMGIPQMASPDEFRQRLSGPKARELLQSTVSKLSYIGD